VSPNSVPAITSTKIGLSMGEGEKGRPLWRSLEFTATRPPQPLPTFFARASDDFIVTTKSGRIMWRLLCPTRLAEWQCTCVWYWTAAADIVIIIRSQGSLRQENEGGAVTARQQFCRGACTLIGTTKPRQRKRRISNVEYKVHGRQRRLALGQAINPRSCSPGGHN
jgi:hypothetical protein